MGHLGDWSPSSCSRLCLALAYLASYLQRAVASGDRFSVLAFSAETSCIVPWRARGESFDGQARQHACRLLLRLAGHGCTAARGCAVHMAVHLLPPLN